MNCHDDACDRPESCPKKCCRRWLPPFLGLLLLLVGMAANLAGLVYLGLDADDREAAIRRDMDGRIASIALPIADGEAGRRAAILRDVLSARIDSAEAHVADLARVSHDRRRALAGELRKELLSAVAAESVIRGQQVAGERKERRRDLGFLADQAAGTFGQVGRDVGEIERKIDAIEKRLKAIKGCNCPPVSPTIPMVPGKNLPQAMPPR
jgi:hypothetical protein